MFIPYTKYTCSDIHDIFHKHISISARWRCSASPTFVAKRINKYCYTFESVLWYNKVHCRSSQFKSWKHWKVWCMSAFGISILLNYSTHSFFHELHARQSVPFVSYSRCKLHLQLFPSGREFPLVQQHPIFFWLLALQSLGSLEQ